jgi:hypothetical protein
LVINASYIAFELYGLANKGNGYKISTEYNVSQNGLRIEAYPKDLLDIKETINYFDRLKNDKKIRQGAIEIVYFKNVTDFKISYRESEEISKSYQEPKALQRIVSTIFVCETDLAYGIGRMLQTFHEITNPNHKVVVVGSENELKNLILKVL